MYKVNNVSYYESGQGMSGIFTDTFANMLANDGKIDYSIFLNNGSDWSYLNKGVKGNHFAWYPDWVSGVLAIREGPATHDIKYVGAAIVSKNIGAKVINFTKKVADTGWNTGRFMIDAIQASPGSASQYNSFDYAGYTGTKYGFNSVLIDSTARYCTSNTAYNSTFIADYTTLTGDNAKRIISSNYYIKLTNYNPYLADSSTVSGYDIAHLFHFFEIDGELIGVRDPLNMPNSAHWQSWSAYTDGGSTVYVTIGEFGSNVTAGISGALPQNDNVKGIYGFNNNGTTQNDFSTINAVDYCVNSYGLRWHVGNTGISTAKQWRDNVRLGVMHEDGIIEHDHWIVGESAIQASDNPNKTTDYDHIPARGGGGGGDDAEAEIFGWGGNEVGGMVRYYLLTSAEMESLADFMSDPLWTIDYRNCIISMFVVPNSGGLFDAVEPTTIKFKLDDNQKVDTGVSCLRISGVVPNTSATIEIPRMNDNFLDFEPYSKYLLYIPFCGVIQLPDYIAGKEINVKIYPDIPTCSCTAIVTSEDRKIATVRGNIGSSIPVTSDGSGIKTAAVINSMANGIVGVGEALMGGSTGNAGMVAGGVAQALGSVISTTLILGQAFGYSVGSSGDTSFFGAGTRCEYYIAYPQWNNPDTDETNIYGHTFGFVVNKRGKLSDFEGFTVCDNPHVYGFSCTAAEKEEIEMLLRQGIIIH